MRKLCTVFDQELNFHVRLDRICCTALSTLGFFFFFVFKGYVVNRIIKFYDIFILCFCENIRTSKTHYVRNSDEYHVRAERGLNR